MVRDVELQVVEGDVTTFGADVLAVKYAQHFYGADEQVMKRLERAGAPRGELMPAPGDHRLVDARGALGVAQVLWLGMPRLRGLGYEEVRGFGRRAVSALAGSTAGHLALTTHGPGFGLDEIEATAALVRGIREAVEAGEVSAALRRISLVERDARRAIRLRASLDRVLGGAPFRFARPVRGTPSSARAAADTRERPEAPHAFVAMPFDKAMEDVFYYGIHAPVRRAGLLCERVDQDVFAGDILARIKSRIESAAVVIADLTGQNANVYLEVGYAWGHGRPTVLLVQDPGDLKFDVQSQRCLIYENIRDLETKLERELAHLARAHRWPAP